jgi:hypothetical protein
MAPPVQVIDSMEKGVEGQDPKRPRLGKLSPKALFPDETKANEAQGSLGDNMSALRAACTARLMWMISNQQRYQMAHPPQQPAAAIKEDGNTTTREIEKEDSKIDIESVDDDEEPDCVEGKEHTKEKDDDLRRDEQD